MTKASALRELDHDDLVTRLDDAREEYMNLRFQQASGELTDHNRLRITRHEIARIETVIKELAMTADVESEE